MRVACGSRIGSRQALTAVRALGPADVRVVHLDAAGTKVAEFKYNDEYTQVSGLAFSGDAVWLNYGATGTGNNHIRKLDPVSLGNLMFA